MTNRGLVRSARLVPFIVSIFISIVTFMPRNANADCGTPQCQPSADGSGCCKPDCTWMAISTACRDETNACHNGTCVDAGGGARTCQETVPTNSTGTNGDQCVLPTNVCLIGECHSGSCGGIGSAGSGEYKARCPETDGNPCTDHCSAPGNVFAACTTFNVPNGLTCYANSGTNCTKGICSSGACDTTGGTAQNCGTPPTCKRNTCDPVTGCGTEPATGTSCDTNASDCAESVCTDKGNCKNLAQPAGTPCAPGDGNPCTFDECNASKQCNVAIPVPNDPVTDCTNTSTNSCQYDQCYNGTCTIFADTTKNGQVCTTDTNICTNQTCSNGNCNTDTCNGGLACTACGASGTCLPLSQGCGCMPN